MAAASYLVGGYTMHATFKLPINSLGWLELNDERLLEVQNLLKDCALLVIDEAFNFGQATNYWFNRRC